MSLCTMFDHLHLPIGADHTPFEVLESLRDEGVRESRPIGWSEKLGGYWSLRGTSKRSGSFETPKRSPTGSCPGPSTSCLAAERSCSASTTRRSTRSTGASFKPPFSPGRAVALTDHLRADVMLLIDEFIGAGRVNVAEAFTGQIGGRLVAMLCGLPPENGAVYRSWVKALVQTKVGMTPEASDAFEDWNQNFDQLLKERRAQPGDDVISMIAHAAMDGRPLDDDEVRDYFTIILLGTIDNSQLFLSTVIWRMGWDVELRRRLIARPELVPAAVDEFLRHYSSSGESRYVTKTVEIGGVIMEPGQILTMLNNLTNRDPRQFPYPDVFIPDRAPTQTPRPGIGDSPLSRRSPRIRRNERFRGDGA
jgi:Cytochrome P450